MNEKLLEPVKFYENEGKQLHEENSVARFEELLQKSGVNQEENRSTVKLLNAEKAKADQVEKKLRSHKIWRVVLIILAVLGGISTLGAILTTFAGDLGLFFILAVFGVPSLIISIIVLKTKINPAIKSNAEILEQYRAKIDELYGEAKAQVAPLNALFTEEDALRLVEKTMPDIAFDPRFTRANERFFIDKYDYLDMSNEENSVLNTLSGKLAGNPFLFCNRMVHEMGSHTYHGTLTISWTETYRDSKGNIRTRRRTQTLHASLTKPKPYYKKSTHLCFGSQAGPDLSFSRDPQDTEELNDKQIERKVKKGAKTLKKQTDKALKEGKNFQEMANTEFEVLFGALDRDNEVQFRLLFTPLAQRNMTELVKDKDAYGDDFRFVKKRRFNVIQSEHSERWDLDTSPAHYHSHDVDEIRKKFIDFNNEFFKILYFDFAPLLSIPAYVEEPCAALEEIEDYDCNYTYYEHEVMANALGRRHFAHEDSATDAILKVGKGRKKGDSDVVSVTAHSYRAEDRLDFVPVLGGDGQMHLVPVHWVEYLPIRKTTDMAVSPYRENANGNSQDTCFHGMVARTLE